MRIRRSDLNDELEYPETLSLGSWIWRWTGSVLATESGIVGGSEARLRFAVGTAWLLASQAAMFAATSP